MRIDLPGGQWAELRDPEGVSDRDRRALTRIMRRVRPEINERQDEIARMDDGPDGKPTPEKRRAIQQLQYEMTDDEADAYDVVGDLAAATFVESWSFPAPVTADAVADLPHATHDVLVAKMGPLVSALWLDASPGPNSPAPTGGSNGSAMLSEEVQRTTSRTSGGPSSSSSSG